jgi:hypothetical protein
LGQIHAALTRATGVLFDEDRSSAVGEAVHASLIPIEFLHALQELYKKQPSCIVSGHNLIRSLIEQIEGQVQAGVDRIDATVIQEYLTRVSEAEESFLKAIEERVPDIVTAMSDFKMNGNEASSRMTALEASIQDAEQLRTDAQQVNAGSAMTFFTGLHSLLTVVAQRRVFLAATRVDSVKARLHTMCDAIRQWVEYGRAQRAAIDQLLPADHS